MKIKVIIEVELCLDNDDTVEWTLSRIASDIEMQRYEIANQIIDQLKEEDYHCE
jgi:hypothetical protein